MITQNDVRELAGYESPTGCALTFYYQPVVPKNYSHREELILLKDLVRDVLKEAKKGGRNKCAREDLERILDMADSIQGNHGMAKAIFADSSNGFWREFNLPARLDRTQITVNQHFHLKQIASLLYENPKVCVVIADSEKARLFDYSAGKVREIIDFFHGPPETEGLLFARSGDDRLDRSADELTKHHYKHINDVLLKTYERGGWDAFAFGCRDGENWTKFRDVLHPYIADRSLGRFRTSPTSADDNVVREGVENLLQHHQQTRRQGLLAEAISEAHSNSHGALGPKRVLKSLERREIETLLINDKFAAPGTECKNCGHLEMGTNSKCGLCGHPVAQIDDITDVIVGTALRNNVEVVYLRENPELDRVGHIAALLRFRADQNTPMKFAS